MAGSCYVWGEVRECLWATGPEGMEMYKVGDKFEMTKDALDNYGEQYTGKVFTVRARYTHYISAATMDSDPTGHPGFDPSGESPLYGSELNFDLYEWEMIPVRRS